MQYGCIGEKLGHSFSKLIHNELTDYEYELKELAEDAVADFMRAKDFKAINVTIPYKQTVIPFLDHIDPVAQSIGAVNTIVNKNGVLYGYNTDFYGLKSLLEKNNIVLSGKKVLILGSGGTSKTAYAVAKAMGAGVVYRVSRTAKEDCITYEEAKQQHRDADVLINTTPAGMFPKVTGAAVDMEDYPRVSGVADAVYNPLRSTLVLSAQQKGINAVGGLYMLVAQAAKAVEYFLETTLPQSETDRVFQKLAAQKENIVLIGMPGCGKSSVSEALAALTGRKTVDTDVLITQKAGKPISQIFEELGEQGFREMETEVIRELAPEQGLIIATGGGAILREENITQLRRNGKLVFLDRPLEHLVATSDRPLSSDRAALEQRYKERYDKYCAAADLKVSVPEGVEQTANLILKEL